MDAEDVGHIKYSLDKIIELLTELVTNQKKQLTCLDCGLVGIYAKDGDYVCPHCKKEETFDKDRPDCAHLILKENDNGQ